MTVVIEWAMHDYYPRLEGVRQISRPTKKREAQLAKWRAGSAVDEGTYSIFTALVPLNSLHTRVIEKQ
jgi:hypothetical protein